MTDQQIAILSDAAVEGGSLQHATLQRRQAYDDAKRMMDVIAALVIGIVALPVVAVAAALIKLDGGDAFYRQERVGRNGQVFTLWKMRSMCADADRRLMDYLAVNPAASTEWERDQKLRFDPRITWIGRVLRKYSIDEIPQLLNVLIGHMSIVGPRPILPEQRAKYPGTAYFGLRPGLTGLWQVSERNNCTFTQRSMYDDSYADRMSPWLDLQIIFRTIAVVVRGTGL